MQLAGVLLLELCAQATVVVIWSWSPVAGRNEVDSENIWRVASTKVVKKQKTKKNNNKKRKHTKVSLALEDMRRTCVWADALPNVLYTWWDTEP